MKGTPVNPKMATYTWTVHDELNQAFSNFTSFNDFMKIGSGLLQKNKQYTVKVVANYNNGAATGHAEIKYITDVDSDYSFNIEPATGVSLVDKFSFSTSSQTKQSELSEFVFGYIKGGIKYPMTRRQPISFASMYLPLGEGVGTTLTCYVEVFTITGHTIMLKKSVTSSATTLSQADFESSISNMHSSSLFDSAEVREKYMQFRGSLTQAKKQEACTAMLNGLTQDNHYVDPESKGLASQVLATTAQDLTEIASDSLIQSALNVFEQITVNENTDLVNNLATEFDSVSIKALFDFTNAITPAINTISSASTKNARNTKIRAGMINVLRGALSDHIPGEPPLLHEGAKITIMATKLNVKAM